MVEQSLKIRVDIGDLILNDFDEYGTMHIAEVIESDLAKLIAEGGPGSTTPLQHRDIETVDAGSIDLPRGSRNLDIIVGSSIAKSIYSSLRDVKNE